MIRRNMYCLIFLLSMMGWSSNSWADEITSQQADTIITELKAIHQLLLKQQEATAHPTQPPRPSNDKVSVALGQNEIAIGSKDAPLTMIEYTDYQCPYCRKFHTETFEEIKKNYIDTGKLRYISRDFPLDMHENAKGAALAAHCADEQGKFWELRHVMITNSAQLKSENIDKYANDLGMDMNKFTACTSSDKYKVSVDQSMAQGQSIGISGTPSFVLGRTTPDKIDGARMVGAVPYATFDLRMKDLLAPTAMK